MTRSVEGDLDGSGLHVGVAVATWNRTVTDRLLEGAVTRLEALGAEVTVLRVPGALELPIAALGLADAGCDAVVAIGTIVRGDTDHYEIVIRESTAGIARVALDTGVPVTNAILAVNDFAHAVERAADGPSNKGFEAAEAAVSTAVALRSLDAG
ncbi:MAG TPA: 6,7-dimethyl-8-ribityllumazine synthase [Acidimicrobiia bacterium]|nr:6,7-dimethyl-8-ribityllumazine synthase [Acidimicrobiia bacterium]